jgi:hypothetical protein
LSSLLCAFTAVRLRLSLPVTELEYALQLACDLLIHSACCITPAARPTRSSLITWCRWPSPP